MNFLEIQFALRGQTLPADHGYSLYSALKNIVSEESKKIILENSGIKDFPPEVILSTIPGVPNRKGVIYLNRSSRLRLRCPSEQAQQWYRLFQSQVLDTRGHLIRLVQPKLCLLEPSSALKARLVTFHLEKWDIHDAPVYFLESCQKSFFNPIENCWSKIKNILRSIGARTYKDLDLAIAYAYSQVSLKDIRNWFAHSCYCISPF